MFLLPHCHSSSGVYSMCQNEMYDGNDTRNGRKILKIHCYKVLSLSDQLSDQLFEGRFKVFTNEIVKPRANTKKVLRRGITKQR